VRAVHRFEDQFRLPQDYYLKQLDFLNWFRYFYIIKEVIASGSRHVLEVGSGSGLVRNCLRPLVNRYEVLDINSELHPDILADVRVRQPQLEARYDCVIIADVLEHLPFADMPVTLGHLASYLRPSGEVIVTVPHRRSHFLVMTPAQRPWVITVPTGWLSPAAFYRRFIKRQIWIDPHHRWEIGDGTVGRRDVEAVFRNAGFRTQEFRKLLYVDFWVLVTPKNGPGLPPRPGRV